MKQGMFITFEGIDGCGKSTQIRKLVQHIFEKSKYHHIVLTRNPYQDTEIRKILTEDADPLTQADKLADLFINDRTKQVHELVKPNMAKGHFVISDRYKLSTITYQAAQGLDMHNLIARHEALPVPDMCFIIDVPAEEASRRMKQEDEAIRGKEHKFEANLDFARQLRDNHHIAKDILARRGENIFIIDGHREPEVIAQDIQEIFDREFARQQNTVKAANVLFYDENGNVLLQDRTGISKWGEEYHFFGGHVEAGETPEETVTREIQEEIGVTLKDHTLFKQWHHFSKEADCYFDTSVFVAPMPQLSELTVKDGKATIIPFEKAQHLKMVPGYNELLQEIRNSLPKKENN